MTIRAERELGRGSRRGAVVAIYGGYVAAAGAWSLSGGLKTLPVQVTVLTGFAAVFAGLAVLMLNTRYWAWGNAPDKALDEFQVASRNGAYRYSYMAVAVIGMLGILFATMLFDRGTPDLAPATGQLLLWAWMLLTLTLPSAILAWTERPLDRD